jgi:hypothetical protein
MITAGEAAYALYGASRLARFDPAGLSYFGNTPQETLRSFYAALVALPIYALLLMLELMQSGVQAPLTKVVLVEAVAYVVGWVAFPLVIYQIADSIGRGDRVHRFIAAYNWTVVLQVGALLAVAIVFAAEVVPMVVATVLWLTVILAILAFQWFVARVGLELSGGGAVGIVAIDFVISLTLNAITARMIQ